MHTLTPKQDMSVYPLTRTETGTVWRLHTVYTWQSPKYAPLEKPSQASQETTKCTASA